MPKFIIEREIPEAGKLTGEQLRMISQKSKDVLCKLGTDIQWIQSYVAGDKVYCIYLAPNKELIMKHAEMGGFPANLISKFRSRNYEIDVEYAVNKSNIELYLTKEKKEWYMQDFEVLILKEDLDKEIIEHLKYINKSDEIQTLYSAFFARRNESYLKICFTENVEPKIKNCFYLLQREYNNSVREECNVRFLEPQNNLMYDPEYPKGILYYDSPDFLRIKHSKIQFISESYKRHMNYWNSLKDQLVENVQQPNVG